MLYFFIINASYKTSLKDVLFVISPKIPRASEEFSIPVYLGTMPHLITLSTLVMHGFLLQQQINLLRYSDAGVAVLAIAIVVSVLDYASGSIREKIV